VVVLEAELVEPPEVVVLALLVPLVDGLVVPVFALPPRPNKT
jgi:hypothetical protein